MPEILFELPRIVVDMPDLAPGIKRRATWLNFFPQQDLSTAELDVVVEAMIQHFHDENGAYGAPYYSKSVHDYKDQAYGNNNTLVVVADLPEMGLEKGDILLERKTGHDYGPQLLRAGVSAERVEELRTSQPETILSGPHRFDWEEMIAAIPLPTMRQGRFFLYAMHNEPLLLAKENRKHLTAKFGA